MPGVAGITQSSGRYYPTLGVIPATCDVYKNVMVCRRPTRHRTLSLAYDAYGSALPSLKKFIIKNYTKNVLARKIKMRPVLPQLPLYIYIIARDHARDYRV